MKEIMVSVVCTNYNKGDWIAEAVESFLKQEVNFNIEILLIDDQSTDHSIDIIKRYEKKYPEVVRGIYNSKNLGITKTWIKACKEANGKYIARCDGDDFWTDTNKLQMQVDALSRDRESLWSSTDFDIILPDGTKTQTSAFEQGVMVRAGSYENMLATKGFTMASTWLVDAALMREINKSIDVGAIDDTFNIQIELFYRTKLTYLPHSMAAYRVGHESDSHPSDILKAKKRNDRLLSTQLEYLEKYQNKVNFVELCRQSMIANTNLEAILLDRNMEILNQKTRLEHAADEVAHVTKNYNTVLSQLESLRQSKKYKLVSLIAHPVRLMRKLKSRFL